MSHLRAFFVANVVITRFFCCKCRDYTLFYRKCRDYTLFGVEFWQKFWQKFLEILRILAEILRKKLACGASGGNSIKGCIAVCPPGNEEKATGRRQACPNNRTQELKIRALKNFGEAKSPGMLCETPHHSKEYPKK